MTSSHSLPPTIESIIEAGRAAPSADNSQPWRFCWDGEFLTVQYDRERVGGKTFGSDDHATLLAIGAVKENMLQLANYLEIEIEEITIDRSTGYFQFRCNSTGRENQPTREHPLFQRHTNRWPYRHKPIPCQVIESIVSMCQGECRTLVFTEREMIRKIARWVKIASEARFQSREVHEFLGQSLRFTPKQADQGDGLDIRTLPLPPGGTLFLRFIKDWGKLKLLNRVGCYKFLALMEARPISRSEALIAITGPDRSADILDAGMLLERVWIHLNSAGVAVHPYYVITDQLERLKMGKIPATLVPALGALKSEIMTTLNPRHGTIKMFFRIGYPVIQPILSSRVSHDTLLRSSLL